MKATAALYSVFSPLPSTPDARSVFPPRLLEITFHSSLAARLSARELWIEWTVGGPYCTIVGVAL
jgi:hypothetical protein